MGVFHLGGLCDTLHSDGIGGLFNGRLDAMNINVLLDLIIPNDPC